MRWDLNNIERGSGTAVVLILCCTEGDVESVAELMEDGLNLVKIQILSLSLHSINYIRDSMLTFESAAAHFRKG